MMIISIQSHSVPHAHAQVVRVELTDSHYQETRAIDHIIIMSKSKGRSSNWAGLKEKLMSRSSSSSEDEKTTQLKPDKKRRRGDSADALQQKKKRTDINDQVARL